MLEQIPCKSQKHLDELTLDIISKGGEGLMIKDPNSKYEFKRSDKLLKIKQFTDAEAKVTGHEKGTGRFSEIMGAIAVVDVKTKKKFKIGTGFDVK